MVKGNLFIRLYLTAVVIGSAVFPRRPERGRNYGRYVFEPSSPKLMNVPEKAGAIRFFLEDLNRAIDRQGELKLLFPGCLPLAAPPLLYRLKRNGFSKCRVLMTDEGLLLTATR
jgi:hypothetical protein